MSQYGHVRGCWVEPRVQTSVTTAAAIDDTELVVVYAGGFPDSGTLEVAGERLDFTEITWGVEADDPDTITLVAPLVTSVEVDDPVSPVVDGVIAMDHLAEVVTEDGDTIMVPVPYAMRPMWPEGVYDAPIPCEFADDASTLENAPGRDPVISGAYIDPTTIPDQLPTDPPDVPTLLAGGTIDALILSAGNLAGTSQVIFHLSATPGFTPDGSTALGPASRTAIEVARTLPDGTPLALDTDYYAIVEAVNAVGSTFSAQVTVRLDATAASTLFAELLVAAEIVADSVVISGVFRINPDEGLVIEHPDGTRTQINADGSGAHFAGTGSFSELDVTRLAVTGENSVIDGILTLGNGIKAPQKPRVYSAFPDAMTTGLDERWDHFGLFDDGTRWVTALPFFGGGYVVEVVKTGGADTFISPQLSGQFQPDGGVVKVGSHWYLLGRIGFDWFVRRYASDFSTFDQWAPDLTADDKATIGLDGAGGLLIAHRDAAGGIWVTGYVAAATKTAGVPLSLGSWTTTTNLVGVGKGSFDFGASRIWVLADNGVRVFTAAGVRQAAQEWNNFAGESNRGLSWDGTRFNQLTSSQRVWKLSPVVTATARTVRTTFYDSIDLDETDGSVATSFTQSPRRRFRVEWDLPPDTGGSHWPDKARVYISDIRQSPEPAVGAKSLTIETPTTGTANIPGANSFPAATAPGEIRSTEDDTDGPLIKLGGAGAGRAGPLAWDSAAGPTDAITSGFYTLESGWTATNVEAIRFGRYVEISMSLARSTSITVPVDGNPINVTAMTLAAGWRPRIRKGAGSHVASRVVTWDIQTSGVVNLAATTPGSDIAASEVLGFTVAYMAGA